MSNINVYVFRVAKSLVYRSKFHLWHGYDFESNARVNSTILKTTFNTTKLSLEIYISVISFGRISLVTSIFSALL